MTTDRSDAVEGNPTSDVGSLTIDVHAHRECAPVREKMRRVEEEAGRKPLAVGRELTKQVNAEQLQTVRTKMDDPAVRLADMDARGIDMQMISITPYQFYYWLEPGPGGEISAEINEDLAAAISKEPRFGGLGTLPLQDPAQAVAEMKRCLDLGLNGVTIGTNVEGEDLSNPRFWEVFEAAEDLGVPLFMHSSGYTCPDRLEDHYFMNLLGHPFEGSVAIAHLIFDGVLERFPDLQLVVAHGGGYLAAYPARLDHGYHARRDVGPDLGAAPSSYLERVHFDTVVFDRRQLMFLIDVYGSHRLLLGSDYPYDMGDEDVLAMIESCELSDDDLMQVTGGNARRVFRVDA